MEDLIKEYLDYFEQEFIASAEEMQSLIVEEKRVFPRETIRRQGVGVTGKVAGSPRDAVDTGELRDSLEVRTNKTQTSVRVEARWSADHAEDVYFGSNDVPPYPWVDMVLHRKNWGK